MPPFDSRITDFNCHIIGDEKKTGYGIACKIILFSLLSVNTELYSLEPKEDDFDSFVARAAKYKEVIKHEVGGKKQGVWVCTYETGEIARIITYKDDEMNGRWMAFYRNGTVGIEGQYEMGKLVGKWIYRNSDGSEQGP